MSQTPIRTDPHQGEIVHVYDGIEEADNRLPRWWLWTFYGSIIFGVFYWFGYQEFKFGKTPIEAYAKAKLDALDTGKPVTAGELIELTKDKMMLSEGAKRFSRDCSRCHGARGQGKIGPNLTDAFWLGGGSPTDIFNTVNRGRENRGMQAWGPVYGRAGVMQVVAYVLTIRDTNVEGKPPEGNRWEPKDEGTEEEGESEPEKTGAGEATGPSEGAADRG